MTQQRPRTQVYFVCDCSGSMAGSLESAMRSAVRDNLSALRDADAQQDFEVRLAPFSTQVRLGMPWSPREILAGREHLIADINTRSPFGGGTALLDAVGRCLEEAEKTLTTDPALILVFTDGAENSSRVWNAPRMRAALEKAEKTGNLTLTVAGPKDVGREMTRLGLNPENFRSWDGTEQELRTVQAETTRAITTYTESRAKGATRSTSFYADASALTPAGIKAMTKKVEPSSIRTVTRAMAGRSVADYYGKDFQQGKHFYQLVKPEKIQDGKDLILFIKAQNEYRLGSRAARALLSLPETGDIRVRPSAHASDYTIFVRSTSYNRKVVEGQIMLTVEE